MKTTQFDMQFPRERSGWSRALPVLILVALLALAGPTRAEDSVAGVCPDGSFFVVSREADAPCARPKFVPASELPPLRPEYLPRPYTWYVDQEERDENNPYNLVDKAQQMRALRSGRSTPEGTPESQAQRPSGELTEPSGATRQAMSTAEPGRESTPGVALDPDELRDLVQLITLSQNLAPATLAVEDVRQRTELVLRFAYSPSFERRILEALGKDQGRVITFLVRSEQPTEFYPRFFATQEGVSHRPQEDERGFVLGTPGTMEAGLVSLGYLILPERFDPTRPMTLWWNDRQIEVTLAAPTG